MTKDSYDIVPAHLAVEAMRDNGYKNAAHAIAELIDNSIQAGATEVELLCGEKQVQREQRRRSAIHQVAVLDNGRGMDATVLRLALQFGNGTYLQPEKHTGIGRFGMGLPSSSISQCQRVDVWSWQDGPENAIYTYLDLEEIRSKRMSEVPEPQRRSIDPIWFQVGKTLESRGTLVVWSNIDRCIWTTGKAIIDNSELIIGRIYRKFLDEGKVSIRMMAFDLNNPANKPMVEKFALPNDPGYLMAKTSCPNPFDEKAMFEAWGGEEGTNEVTVTIDFRDRKHEVKIRFSCAKQEARPTGGRNPGDLPHGKHAAKNIGVSVVRAGRELELDQSLVIKNPTERWWGVEIEFPPSLDDLFGVTNNKQSARNFTELANLDIDSLLTETGKTMSELKEEYKEDGDPRGPLLEIVQKIDKNIKSMRGFLVGQTKGSRGGQRRHGSNTPQKRATAITTERKKEGHKGQSDKDESLPTEERKEIIKKTLLDRGVTDNAAQTLAATTVSNNEKYIFAKANLETAAFFSVQSKGGAIIITLNVNHPAYRNLMEILEEKVDGVDADTLRSRLSNSLEGLQLLLMAWARYEDEQPDGKRREAAQDARVDWGRVARQFLDTE